jgi:hypothetical protein
LWRPESGVSFLYNLTADPGEQKDLARERPRELASMTALLQEVLKLPSPVGDGEATPMDPDTRKRLEGLIYIVPR